MRAAHHSPPLSWHLVEITILSVPPKLRLDCTNQGGILDLEHRDSGKTTAKSRRGGSSKHAWPRDSSGRRASSRCRACRRRRKEPCVRSRAAKPHARSKALFPQYAAWAASGMGKRSTKLVWGCLSSYTSVPPCCTMMPSEMLRPRPVPLPRVARARAPPEPSSKHARKAIARSANVRCVAHVAGRFHSSNQQNHRQSDFQDFRVATAPQAAQRGHRTRAARRARRPASSPCRRP